MTYRHHLRQAPTRSARAISLQARRQQMVARVVSALVGLTLVAGGLLTALNAHAGTTATAKSTASAASAAAATHGTVQAVQAVQVKGKGSGVGVVAGAVLGGLVGNQMGKGTGNTVMTVGGAVAGGYAGNEVEKNVKKQTLYKTTVKLDDGTVHEYTVGQQFAVGAKVNVSGKKLTLAH
ncbi:MAG: glycine zipper 2TM domain-containing protein [Aquabacterium sp.]|uniref:glycine zipper 2TM domain-containing protein n=1 Tax=Aquabacterium sp. TaxID=1872578 RepID=UPI0025B94D26|nr:glycine zipper 2TM domain-containing protein [Aquabacterium sp.]MBI3382418.1 glycine zipper 2TM domain-containing protein [Aquabacterium sp.]